MAAGTIAQSGPSFTVTFSPGGSQHVGQDVDIHVIVNASTYGASKITVSCDGVSKTETSELDYHSTWHTGGCNGGGQSIQVCTKSTQDQQWQQANCQNFGYFLTGSNPGLPTIEFWADHGNRQQGQCTTMHWRTTGANRVSVEGNVTSANGDQQICPTVTKMYNIDATGPGGTAYANFTVTVSIVPQPQNEGPTNQTANQPQNVPSASGGPTLAQARQQGTPGGIDVVVYCAAKGWPGPTNAPDYSNNAAYSWGCGDISLGDFTQVCRDVYGNNYHAENAMDSNRLGGWRCIPSGQSLSNPQASQSQQSSLTSNCSGVRPHQLVLGQTAVVTQAGDRLNLRAGPSTNEQRQGQLRTGDTAVVISGPQCANGYWWWQLQTSSQGTWWAVEADSRDYWLATSRGQTAVEPQTQQSQPQVPQVAQNASCGSVPSRLSANMRAVVTDFDQYPLRIRNSPSLNGTYLGNIPIRSQVDILSGPTCADGETWIRIRYNGLEGWSSEVGQNGVYNLAPINNPVAQQPQIGESSVVLVPFTNGYESFNLRFNRQTYRIENGAEIIRRQINATQNLLVSSGTAWPTTLFTYFFENSGGSEQLREQMQEAVCGSDSYCRRVLRVQVGTRHMDTSGVGNVLFGYFMSRLSTQGQEDLISNWAQRGNNQTRQEIWDNCNHGIICFALVWTGTVDNPDDVIQRELGRQLALRGAIPDAIIEDLAQAVGLV